MVFMDPNNLPQPAELEAALKNFHSRFHEVREFRRMLDYESHRGCALAAAAFLDERLKQLLGASFIPECVEELLEGGAAPLGTFTARILAAKALGLLPPKAARDLHLIRKIRNEFAHNLDCASFEVPEVTSRCRELYYCFSNPQRPRSRFTNATTGILAVIDFKTAFATPPVPPPDSTGEEVQKNFKDAARRQIAVQDIEKEAVMQKLGISDSTSIIDLLDLAGKYGLLESQPPRENMLILEVLERLIMATAQKDGDTRD
jgi:hypothetical protein